MEMTLNEAKKELLKHKSPYYNCVADAEANEAIDIAVSTMRKYQKIKEQVDIAIDKENFAISDARLIQIREIINGNDV